MNRHAHRPSLDDEGDTRAALSEICSGAAMWRHMREEASAALALEPALAPLLVGSILNRSSFAEAVIRRVSAKLGAPAGSVDDAVRSAYESWGYGPGYKLPGLSHRTGHGIGMEGHEPVNLVHGEATPLAPGMCFSNEPGIYLPGKFGIRLEDCFHMTAAGPKWFSEPPKSLEEPIGRGA